jgi:hypothetical protein
VKGSESNPANITGVSHKSVGSLTNWPAFKNILPVRAKQAEPQPETTNAGQITGLKMRVKLLKARGSNTAGTYLELEDNDAVKAVASGEAMPEHAAQAIEARDAELVTIKAKQTESDKSRIVEAIDRGVKRGALLPKGTDAKSQETIKATQFDRLLKGADVNLLIEMLDNMPQVTNPEGLTGRRIQAENGSVDKHVFGGEPTAAEVVEKIISASGKDRIGSAIGACHRPLSLQQGGSSLSDIQAAAAESLDNARLLKAHVLDAYNKQGDWALRQMVRAISDVTDPNTQVGTLSSTLVLMRNLGYLKNKLNFMPYISTDLRAEPARYGQSVLTRYITPPNVLTYVPGTGYTSDATAISNYIANLGTNKANIGTSVSGVAADVAGTHTLSAPSTTDVPVIINNHTGVEIRFPTSTIGATVRNLFAEQQGAQMYSLAEFINKVFLATVFSATWNGISATALPLGGNTFGLSGVVKIKNKFSINKMPDTGRFAVLHSVYHDNILTDASLLTAKAILAVNGGESDFETGELPTLFGIKVLESQLAAYKSAGSVAAAFTGLVTPTDPTTIAAVAPDGIGFAGNSASALFVARLPQDYTTVLPNIPATAAIEIVTEPDSGLSLLFTKYVDHSLAEVKARCAIMFGFAQGDPRQGFVLTP